MAKPFKETGLGKFLSSKGFNAILDTVGAYVPVVGMLDKLKDQVMGTEEYQKLSPDDQQLFLQLHQIELDNLKEVNRAEESSQAQLTERSRIDMASDSWLSKNIRPMTLIYLTLVITVLCVLASCNINFKIEDVWVKLFGEAWLAVLSFYFIGREVQKFLLNRKNAK